MFYDHEIGKAIWIGTVAIVCGVLAWQNPEWPDWLRLILAGLALLCIVVFGFWIMDLIRWLITRLIADLRTAWYAPIVRQLEIVERMTPGQLAVVGKTALALKFRPAGHGRLEPIYETPLMDLTAGEVADLLEETLGWPKFPAFPPQHGLPDSGRRRRLQAFTELAVALGLAERAALNRPAVWIADRRVILAVLQVPPASSQS